MVQHAILITLMIGASKEEAAERVQKIVKRVITPAGKLGVIITFYPVHSRFFNEFIEDINGAKVRYTLNDDSRPPKGFCITHLLKGIHLLESKPDYIIYCDGSGRIPFEQCLNVLKKLQKKEFSGILTNRVPWRSGTDFRNSFSVLLGLRSFFHCFTVTLTLKSADWAVRPIWDAWPRR